jgi:hypothetical protein
LYGGGTEFGPPTLADLIDLGHSQCRAPAQVTPSDGAKVPCVCGRSVEDCKRHARHRMGFYVRMTDVGRGFQGHGLVGTFYTQEQVKELQRQDLEEMENLTTGMTDGNWDDEDGSVASPSRVSFRPNLGSTTTRDSPKTPTTNQLRDELVETTHTDKKKTEDPPLWYGLVDVAGARWVFQNLKKAQEYVDTKVFRFARIFESKAEALTWRSGGQNDPLDVPPSSIEGGQNAPLEVLPSLIGDDDLSAGDLRNTTVKIRKRKRRKSRLKRVMKGTRSPQDAAPKGSTARAGPPDTTIIFQRRFFL